MELVQLPSLPTDDSAPPVKRTLRSRALAQSGLPHPGGAHTYARGMTSTRRTPPASSFEGTVATSGMWMEMSSLNMGWVYGPSLLAMMEAGWEKRPIDKCN